MQMAIAGAWARWAEMWKEAKEMRVLLERCARKMKNKCVASAFDRWCEMAEESKDMKRKSKKIVMRMLKGCMMARGPAIALFSPLSSQP
jgi:hypothetical protein